MKVKIRAWCIVKFEKIFSYERSFINEKQKIVESCGRKIAMGRIFLNKTERKTILFGHSFSPLSDSYNAYNSRVGRRSYSV